MKNAFRAAFLCLSLSLAGSALASEPQSEDIVSLPDSRWSEVKKHTPEQDEEWVSSNRPTPPLLVRRAKNLLSAGHPEEALKDFAEGLPSWKISAQFRNEQEVYWGIACESVGKNEEALEHYKKFYYQDKYVQLLLKLKRYKEAKFIADGQLIDLKVLQANRKTIDEDYPRWLRLRACANAGLHDDKAAVEDLKEAANIYQQDDLETATRCIDEANKLIARSNLGAPLKTDSASMPREGADKVLTLIKHFFNSPDPLNLDSINKIIGAKLKLPGETWHNIVQEHNPPAPFVRIEYRGEDANYRIPHSAELTISDTKCAIPMDEILKLVPANAKSFPGKDFWDNDVSRWSDAWELPTGLLTIHRSEKGLKVINKLYMKVKEKAEKETSEDLSRSAGRTDDDNKKIELLTKSLILDDKNIETYLERAKIYLKQKRYSEALNDTKQAVNIAGRPLLIEQAKVEYEKGDLSSAINHMNEFIGAHEPGPETSDYFSLLAEMYLKQNEAQKAIDACQKSMVGITDNSKTLFLQAKAKAALKDYAGARKDADLAAREYFDKARIVLRDEVLDWVKTLPVN